MLAPRLMLPLKEKIFDEFRKVCLSHLLLSDGNIEATIVRAAHSLPILFPRHCVKNPEIAEPFHACYHGQGRLIEADLDQACGFEYLCRAVQRWVCFFAVGLFFQSVGLF